MLTVQYKPVYMYRSDQGTDSTYFLATKKCIMLYSLYKMTSYEVSLTKFQTSNIACCFFLHKT
jgi:hypothetical protein